MKNIPIPAHRFEALDGLRGILALTIALFHISLLGHFYDFPSLRTSGVAVDFFFILSGFVITHASAKSLTGWNSFRVFAVRRFGRVWPLHAVVLGVFVLNELLKLATTHATGIAGQNAAFAPDGSYSLISIPTNLLLIQALGIHDQTTWNGPSWSISTEFYTYLIFAVVVILARKRLTPVAGLISVASAVALLVLAITVPGMDNTYQFGILRCIASFFSGYLVYRLWQSNHSQPLAYPAATEFLAIALMLLFPLATHNNLGSYLVPFVFAIPVWVFAYQAGPVSKLLNTRPLQLLGLWSYAIYICHGVILLVFKRVMFMAEKVFHHTYYVPHVSPWASEPQKVFNLGNPWLMDAMAIGYLLAVILLAAVASRFIEVPARNWFNTRAKKLK